MFLNFFNKFEKKDNLVNLCENVGHLFLYQGLQDDPRYNDLINMRAKYSGANLPPGGASTIISGNQMNQYRAQIMAYR